jgi:hypothetical protein
MKIRCPNCDRMGYLPDHLVPAANTLRCRRCRANFVMPARSLTGIEPRLKDIDSWRGTTLEMPAAGRARENPALLLTEGFVAGYDEPEAPVREPGPGDSQYELTFALNDAPDPSSDDWLAVQANALEPEAPSSDEIEAVVPPASDPSRFDRMSYRRIESWIRPFFFILLGFVALSVVLIGFLVIRGLELGSTPALALGTYALVIASLGLVSFLLFGLWMVFLSIVLTDVAQNFRRQGDPENRERGR